MTALHNPITFNLDPLLANDVPVAMDLHALTQLFDQSFFKKGEAIFRERNPAWGVYYVRSGKLKLYKLGSDGKEQIIRVAHDGDLVGYADVLGGSKYNLSAALLKGSTLTFIPRSDFLNLFSQEPAFAEHVMSLLCHDVQLAEKRITDMAYRPVRGRLAEALLALDKIYQQDDDEQEDFINLSRQDLANLLGTATKETVIRLLSELRSERLITTDGYRISILNPQGLRDMSLMYDKAY
jgi:CRP/FNR family transcriptional regulator, polysaccharide utilization system transcription regulator